MSFCQFGVYAVQQIQIHFITPEGNFILVVKEHDFTEPRHVNKSSDDKQKFNIRL